MKWPEMKVFSLSTILLCVREKHLNSVKYGSDSIDHNGLRVGW